MSPQAMARWIKNFHPPRSWQGCLKSSDEAFSSVDRVNNVGTAKITPPGRFLSCVFVFFLTPFPLTEN